LVYFSEDFRIKFRISGILYSGYTAVFIQPVWAYFRVGVTFTLRS